MDSQSPDEYPVVRPSVHIGEYWLVFLFLGIFSSVLLIMRATDPTVIVLLCIAIWAFCRCYYFVFYVIQHYVDSEYRFAGLLAFLQYALSKRRRDQKTDPQEPE